MVPNERAPINPLPVNFKPPGGTPYHVLDGDRWESVAAVNRLDVKKLIYFNFHTLVPEEINWYLRRNTGCVVPHGPNWAFSKSATPGVIYLYPLTVDFDSQVVNGKPGRQNQLARILDDHADDFENGITETIEYIADIYDIIHSGVAIAGIWEVGLAAGLFEATGPFAMFVGGIMAMENAYKGAFNALRRDEFLAGLAEGVVLGANDAQPSYVKYNFARNGPIFNASFPDRGNDLANAHNAGIVVGYGYGKQLNTAEKVTLFHELNARMRPNPEVRHGPNYWKQWNEAQKRDYYIDAAVTFRAAHLPR